MKKTVGLLLVIGLVSVFAWLLLARPPAELGRSPVPEPGRVEQAVASSPAEAGAPVASVPAAVTSVDLSALRAAMPENLYWALGEPTTDEVVLARRAAGDRERNRVFGRIQAGEADDAELHAYFEAQRRLHQDYLDFSLAVLSRYGEQLPERDRGLYELSARMHRDRLAELPQLEAEAVARKHAQDERRREWEAAGRR